MDLNKNNPEFSRNLGFFSEEEQEQMINSTVSIAGAGGDGGALALQLARLGVGEIRLADPEPFETENINRQAVCTTETLGQNKAEAVGAYVKKINPGINVEVDTQGVDHTNVESFISGADLLIDETEFTIHAIGVMLARQARGEGIPNLMALNVGFGFQVTTYHPEGRTLESALGLSEDASLEEINATEVPIDKWLPYLPEYIDPTMLEKVAKGEKSAPSVGPGVALAAGAAAVQAFLNLSQAIGNNRPEPVYAPEVLVYDAMTLESRRVEQSSASFEDSMGKILNNFTLKKTPLVSF